MSNNSTLDFFFTFQEILQIPEMVLVKKERSPSPESTSCSYNMIPESSCPTTIFTSYPTSSSKMTCSTSLSTSQCLPSLSSCLNPTFLSTPQCLPSLPSSSTLTVLHSMDYRPLPPMPPLPLILPMLSDHRPIKYETPNNPGQSGGVTSFSNGLTKCINGATARYQKRISDSEKGEYSKAVNS